MRKLAVFLLVSGAIMLGLAPQAMAHNVLISTDPPTGGTVETGPARVSLTFNQYVQPGGSNQVAVTGPEGKQWAEGELEVNGAALSAPLRPLGPAGEYTIGYRIISADGHPVEGASKFTLSKPGNGTPADGAGAKAANSGNTAVSTNNQADDNGVPIWVWVLGAVVLLVVGLTTALRVGGKKPGS